MDNAAMVTKTTFSSSWILVGSELSPFTLKLMALFDYVGLPYRTLPDEGSTWENLKILLRKELLVRGYLPQLWPKRHALSEYPLVPFLFGDKGENLFDSSAIAYWLDHGREDSTLQPLCLPHAHEEASFICHLLDEYADEYGLYMVHHNRWVLSAKDNNAGQRLARELRSLLGPFQRIYAHWFSARQVKRLPYLFSVAEDGGFRPGLTERRQPPSRPGFPPTQTLLNQSFERLLRTLDALLTQRPYVLGDRFTLADASLYGQLAMNLKDPSACAQIRQQAPALYEWLNRIQAGRFVHHAPAASPNWQIDAALTPLIHEVCRTYVPLMQQNMAAWQQYQNTGETLYNEKAFWRNRSLYDGKIDGQPFRAVVKSFQVLTWARLIKHWHALSADQKRRLIHLFPGLQIFEKEEIPNGAQP